MRAAIITLLVTTMATAAFAATGAPAPEPGILCWAFLGFCAAVLVGQTVPAVMLALGTLNKATRPPRAANHR